MNTQPPHPTLSDPQGFPLWNTKLATNNIIRGFEPRVGHSRFCIDLWSQQALCRALVTSGLVQSSGHSRFLYRALVIAGFVQSSGDIRSCTELWSQQVFVIKLWLHQVLNTAQVTAGYLQSSGHSRFCTELWSHQVLYRALDTIGFVFSSELGSCFCKELWTQQVLYRAQVTAGFVQSSGHSRFCTEL